MMYINEQLQERPLCGKKRSLASISNRNDNNASHAVKQQRRVRFSESSTDDLTISTSKSPSYEQGKNSWYSKRELAIFTKRARDHVLGFTHPSEESTRGYERYNIDRMQQKTMTRKIILLLMRQKVLSDEEKSIIANKSSSWAVEEAFVQGCMDFCEAYHPQLTHILEQPSQEQTNIAKNFQQNKRRRLNTPSQTFNHREILSRAA
mmetsp:Transcript_1190/g.2586  ORF Transcript_1190/g.2586 Transcript_1190/m.2586 type:complete len:206 (-) Transcript_1190:66-683(-)